MRPGVREEEEQQQQEEEQEEQQEEGRVGGVWQGGEGVVGRAAKVALATPGHGS